jgi:hypothetical protein
MEAGKHREDEEQEPMAFSEKISISGLFERDLNIRQAQYCGGNSLEH